MIPYFDFLGDELAKIAEEHFVLSKEAGYNEVSFTSDILRKLVDEFGDEAVRAYERRDNAYRIKINTPVSIHNRYAFHGKEHQELQRKLNYLQSGGSSDMYGGV